MYVTYIHPSPMDKYPRLLYTFSNLIIKEKRFKRGLIENNKNCQLNYKTFGIHIYIYLLIHKYE